jgi:hypothetical protein
MYETFVRRNACWHTKCKQRLVHGTKLDRMLSTPDSETGADSTIVDDDGDGASSPKKPRSTRSTAGVTDKGPNADPICFFL